MKLNNPKSHNIPHSQFSFRRLFVLCLPTVWRLGVLATLPLTGDNELLITEICVLIMHNRITVMYYVNCNSTPSVRNYSQQ